MIFLSKHLQLVKPIGLSTGFTGCEYIFLLFREEIYGPNTLSVQSSYFIFHTNGLNRCPLKYCRNETSDGSSDACKQTVNPAALAAHDATPPAVLTSTELICHLNHQALQDSHTETTVSVSLPLLEPLPPSCRPTDPCQLPAFVFLSASPGTGGKIYSGKI